MFGTHTLTFRGAARLFDPWTAVFHSPDDMGGGAGDAGGGDPAGDAGGYEPNDGGDGGQAPPQNDDDEPLERLLVDDDEDEGPEQRREPLTEAEKKLRRKNAKLRRRLARVAPQMERLRSIQDLDGELDAARSFRELSRAVQSGNTPAVLRMLGIDEASFGKGDRPGQNGGRSAAPTVQLDDVEFDDSPEALGFDPNGSPANKSIAAAMRTVAQLQKTVARLLNEGQMSKAEQHKAKLRTTYDTWNGKARQALSQVPKHLHGLFKDHIKRVLISEGFSGKADPDTVINTWLKSLKSDPSGRMQGADTQRRAEAAGKVPQSQRLAGQGASAVPNSKKTLASVGKQIRSMAG